MLGIAAGAGLVAAVAYSGVLPAWSVPNSNTRPLVSTARRGTLRIVVTERGNIESSVTVDGICEINATQIKIIQLVPEGTHVKKGDVVCKFDSSEIDKNIAQQAIKCKQAGARIDTTRQEMEIQRNKGESDTIAAQVELTLARLDLEKYQKGDYPAETTKQKGEIGLKKKDLQESTNKLEQYQGLMKKGFKTPEQVRVQEMEVARLQLQYESSILELKVKENFDYKRKTTEHTAKVDQSTKKVEQARATAKAQMSKAASEYESAQATSDIEQQQLKEYMKQKDKTVLRAEQPGIVAYANDAWYDSSRQIREGATVYSLQKVFTLPDMTRMQVKVNIHESLIKKLRVGQKAEIRIDAFPNIVFVGSVTSVSQLADSTRPWLSGGVKQYPTVVKIEDLQGHDLKPGMTAEVRVLVGQLDNVQVVPVQAIAEHKGDFYAFVDLPGKVELRKVKIGDNNETHVQVVEGLSEGESVALDARLRAAEVFKTDEEKSPVAAAPIKDRASGAPGS